MNESAATSALLGHYRKLRPSAFVIKLSQRYGAGVPDVLIVDNGAAWFIEAKCSDNTLSDKQRRTLAALEKANPGRNLVCWIDRKTRDVQFARHGSTFGHASNLRGAAHLLVKIITGLDSSVTTE